MIQRNQYMSVNVIITMRWWGNPTIFPSVVCLCVHVCVCVYGRTPECVLCQCRQWVGIFAVFMCGYCVWTEWSLYSRHVVYSVLSDSLLPASVVYLCSLWEVWLTPRNWPTRNWPDLTGSDHTSRNKPKTTGWNQDRGKQSSLLQITHITTKAKICFIGVISGKNHFTDLTNVQTIFFFLFYIYGWSPGFRRYLASMQL